MTEVRLSQDDGRVVVATQRYWLATHTDRPFVSLRTPGGEPIADLFIPACAHTTAGRDDTPALGAWGAAQDGAAVTLTLTAASSLWREKRYALRCLPDRIVYEATLVGDGDLAEVTLLGGYCSALPRWGSGFFPSGQHFRQLFSPEPSCAEEPCFAPDASAAIDLLGVPLPGRDDWFFTPPPFCFAAEHAAGWLGLGVEPRAGEHGFTAYRYAGARGAFHLRLDYEGHTPVRGELTLPALALDFADGPYAALEAHCRAARARAAVPPPAGPAPAWWSSPIFCGWGAQAALAAREGGPAPAYGTQARYESFLATLEAADLDPGIVVLDDKWQASYGANTADPAKWPALDLFVARQHVLGRKVLLWLKLWAPEGLPADECVTNAAGLPVAADPSSPAFERRLRAQVRRMLGPDGYDADGFKLDFSARAPSGPGLRRHGPQWGLELLRRYLWILTDEARRVKPDALVIAHTPHPYLSDLVSMVRLNDINTGRPILPAMLHRARVARAACPAALLDTDNWPCASRADWRAYLAAQPAIGVPSLYYVDHIDTTGEPLEPEDYAALRAIWGRAPGAAERRARRAAANREAADAREPAVALDPLEAPPAAEPQPSAGT